MQTLSINREAFRLVQQLIAGADHLGVLVSRLENGATVIDLGQHCPGSWLAGKYYAEIVMGGVGEVSFETFQLDEYTLPAVRVTSAHPLLVGWVCQKHVQPPPGAGREPIFCGPIKALLHPPEPSVAFAGYRDDSDVGVASFQTDQPIPLVTAERLARDCRIRPENLYLLVAPSASLACAIQVAARPIDQAMAFLDLGGLDIHAVRYATGIMPIAPLAADEMTALGRLNDSMIYGTSALVYVEGDDAQIARMVPRLPRSAQPQYGRLFRDLLAENDNDFHRIDVWLQAMAAIQVNNIASGRTFSAGAVDRAVLRRSFFGEQIP